ncbi:methyl-accepting chemotaxis protein [Roseomonas sp. GCM10028921]
MVVSSLIFISVATLFALLGAVVAVVWLVRGVSRPVLDVAGTMRRMAGGELNLTIAGQDRKDEIGEMARARGVPRQGCRWRAPRGRAEEECGGAAPAGRAAGRAAQGFRKPHIQHMLDGTHSAAERLGRTAVDMTRAAEQGTQLTGALSSASDGASANAQTAAAATEELTASIGEITRRSPVRPRWRAVQETERTDRTLRDLAETGSRIGEVVRLINDIAGQTSHLALNATIEAARAGEAGRGFAVVASEVKSLAAQTAKATEEIGQQVAGIQGATGQAVEATQAIGEVVSEINETTSAIAAAVEGPGAATQEIARNVSGAAEAAQSVSRETGVVRDAAATTGVAAGQVRDASAEVSRLSDALRDQVNRFMADVRAA